MSAKTRVQELIEAALESSRTPEELCRDCPELLPEVKRGLREVGALGDRLQELFPTPPASTNSFGAPGWEAPPARPTIPGYEVLGELGHGGMGIVYRARQTRLKRLVALKMILAGGVGAGHRARFQTEAEAAARLQHPNIVQVYEVGDHEGRPFLALEYCGGGSLGQKLQGTPLPARQAAALVETLARAVQVAHGRHIVHRDLKPANVLLTEDGTPKVADFGLAKKLDEAGQTHAGAVLGTPSYMAPEQAGGRSDAVGFAADVYALGAILYECLTGRPPFRAATAVETLRQVLHEEPVPLRQVNPQVPRDLETVCLKCLQKDPGKRYGSAQELADELGRFRKGEPIRARPAGRAERGWRWCRRNPALALTAALAAAALAGLSLTAVTFAVVKSHDAAHQARLRKDLEVESGLKDTALTDLARANRDLETANGAKDAALTQKAQALNESERRRKLVSRYTRSSALLAYDRAMEVSKQGRPDAGLLWLVRALEVAGDEWTDLHRPIRTSLDSLRRDVHPVQQVLAPEGQMVYPVGSPTGDLVLTCSYPGRPLRVWERATGKLLANFGAANFSYQCTWAPDGKTVVAERSAPARNGLWTPAISFWDPLTGKLLVPEVIMPRRPPNLPSVSHLNLTPCADGRRVLYFMDSKHLLLVDISAGRPQTRPLDHDADVTGAAFNPDGSLLLTADQTGTVRRWDPRTGKTIGSPWSYPSGAVTQLAYLPDGRSFLVVGNKVLRCDAVTGKVLATAPEALPGFGIHDTIRLSRDGRTLVISVSGRSQFAYWDVATLNSRPAVTYPADDVSPDTLLMLGRIPRRLYGAEGQPLGQSLSATSALMPGGDGLFEWGSPRAVRLLGLARGRHIIPPVHHLMGSKGPERFRINDADLSPDGTLLLTGAEDCARLWDARTGRSVWATPTQGGAVVGVRFAPDGKTFLTRDRSHIVCWDTSSRKARFQANASAGSNIFAPPGGAGLYAPDARTVLLPTSAPGQSVPNCLRLYRVDTGAVIGPPLPAGMSYGFSPDGKWAVVGHTQYARLWDTTTGSPAGDLLGKGAMVDFLGFSRDSRTFLTREGLARVRAWAVPSARALGLDLLVGPGDKVVLSPDGSRVVVATRAREGLVLRVHDVRTGKPVGQPIHYPGWIGELAFTEDGGKLVHVRGAEVRWWDIASGTLLSDARTRRARLAVDRPQIEKWNSPPNQPAFLPDGRSYLTRDQDGTYLRDVSTGRLLGPPWTVYHGGVFKFVVSQDRRAILLFDANLREVQLAALPRPVQGTPERLRLWAEVITGRELTDDGQVADLDAATWRSRRQRLQELGGPP